MNIIVLVEYNFECLFIKIATVTHNYLNLKCRNLINRINKCVYNDF